MSVTIGYKPARPDHFTYVEGGSTFLSILEKAFGVPSTLDESHIAILEGMALCGYEGARELKDAILEYGSIDIKAVW